MTLLELVTSEYERQQRKHGLREDFARCEINSMGNYEFLQTLSDALEKRISELASKGL